MRLAILAGLPLWIGSTLLLSRLRWFARPPLVERLRPYVPGGMANGSGAGVLSMTSFAEVIGPVSRSVGENLARLFGVSEALTLKLERLHRPQDATQFRIHQVGWMTATMGLASLVALAVRPATLISLFLVIGGPLLAFLILEQRVVAASTAHQHRLFLELPVLAEQLGMLLAAGFSLGSAIHRLSVRGTGVGARDLRRVESRIRQGLSETEALQEWADVARVAALDRLVPILALNRQSADLGALISAEARAIRRDVQRELVETMERRNQSVWVPVTVATLVPGVIFLAIPFIEALRLFSGS